MQTGSVYMGRRIQACDDEPRTSEVLSVPRVRATGSAQRRSPLYDVPKNLVELVDDLVATSLAVTERTPKCVNEGGARKELGVA